MVAAARAGEGARPGGLLSMGAGRPGPHQGGEGVAVQGVAGGAHQGGEGVAVQGVAGGPAGAVHDAVVEGLLVRGVLLVRPLFILFIRPLSIFILMNRIKRGTRSSD